MLNYPTGLFSISSNRSVHSYMIARASFTPPHPSKSTIFFLNLCILEKSVCVILFIFFDGKVRKKIEARVRPVFHFLYYKFCSNINAFMKFLFAFKFKNKIQNLPVL